MFPYLKAEMAKRGMTVQSLSEKTGIPYSTLVPKLRGERPLKVDEACNIKAATNSKLSVEELFSKTIED